MAVRETLLIVAVLFTGLYAGLLYSFSVAVVPGLRAASAKAHIEVMQGINDKIENPAFFASFGIPVVLLPLGAYLYRSDDPFGWLIAASILHIAGGVGLTIVGNLPRNAQLAKIDSEQITTDEAENIRRDFHRGSGGWMLFHLGRTVASAGALALAIVAVSLGG